MIAASIALAAAAAHGCSGFYAYVPRNLRGEIPFSLQVRDKRVIMKAMDFDGFDVPTERRADRSLSFENEQGTEHYRLVCCRDKASVTIAYARGTPVTYRLVRARTDIFGVAKAKGWPIGD